MLWARCAALLLCAFLVAGSLDSVPDPPAIRPHSTDLKFFNAREAASDAQQHFHCGFATDVVCAPVRFVALAFEQMPRETTPSVVLSRFASDPSPPLP